MRRRIPWIPVALFLMAGCENQLLAPNSDAPAVTPQQSVAHSGSANLGQARWLTIRSGGLYDDQGRLRMSPARVHALRVDRVFEMHRQDKLERLQRAASRHTIPVPGEVSHAVAADDPCFFDATVWCQNEYGGELGGGAGGGGGGSSGDSGSSYDDGTMGCANLVNNMNYAYRMYIQAQALYMEMASESPGEGGAVPGLYEGALSAQYSKMMSYRDDYNTWRNLAIRYRCI